MSLPGFDRPAYGMTEPTVIRGHLAEVGSPAEAYLVAWGEVLPRVDAQIDLEVARQRCLDELAAVAAARTSPDLYIRESWGRRGWRWQTGQALRRAAVQELYAAGERADLAPYLLLLAQGARGYLGEEPITTGTS